MMEALKELYEICDSLGRWMSNTPASTPAQLRAIVVRIERELVERYLELPEDDDGKPWHIGDLAQSKRYPYGKPREVCGVGVINGKDVLFYRNGCGHVSELYRGLYSGWDYAEDVCHYQPDTWERIIEDACKRAVDDYPDKRGCIAMTDLVARCKALAGDAE